jgi:demethylmenaquinone methyltransferase/2-methoxy-6-polyprenyl-1,4-benzoquinol methylase
MNAPAKNWDRQVEEQKRYYNDRAPEYDHWFLREGRYDRGPALNQRWFDDIAELKAFVDDFGPREDLLELAAGTGLWTQELLRHVEHVTVVDASPEMIAQNRIRIGRDAPVDFIQTDLFEWQPDRGYDTIFFGFWLSHVPQDRFESFWDTVRAALNPGGRVCFVDSALDPSSSARDHKLSEEELAAQVAERSLDDGRRYQIVKVFHEPAVLQERLRNMGWSIEVGATDRYFIYGSGGLQ